MSGKARLRRYPGTVPAWGLSLLGCTLLFTLTACGERQPAYPARQAPAEVLTDAAQIAAGKVLFREKCATCHGHPDEGRSPRADFFQPPAPDFATIAYRTADPAYLFWRIEVGKTVEPYLSRGSVMPSWRGLSDEQIWQLVAYLKSRAG